MLTHPSAHAQLRERIAGDVVLPGEDGYDAARHAWNLCFDQRPVAVAIPRSAQDVAEIVRHAREAGVTVAVQATGHNAGVRSSLDDTILIRMSDMTAVTVDPDTARATAQGGAVWEDVIVAAAAYGLTGLAGSAADVGIVGYSLGGGIGWLSRSHGITASSVLSAEVVTADGTIRRIDPSADADLFWAIRGGGGGFGVVTSLEFCLYPVAELYAGSLFWPWEHASRVLHAWRALTETAPDELSSVARILQIPDIPDVPEPFRGRRLVAVQASYTGDAATGAQLLAPLRALASEVDTFAVIPAPALLKVHMDPEQPVPGRGDGGLLRELTPEAIDRYVELAGPGSGTPLVSSEIRHLGGAIARPAAGGGVLDRIEESFAIFSIGIAPTPEATAAVTAHLDRLHAGLEPWQGRRYVNFADAAVDPAAAFPADAVERLAQVRAAYDPDGLIRA